MGSTRLNSFCDENFFIFCMWVSYHITTQLAQQMICNQANKTYTSLLTQILRKWGDSIKLRIVLINSYIHLFDQ